MIERFFLQALKMLYFHEVIEGDIVDAFNQRIISTGISPTITTRPEGFKTAILVVVK